MTTITDLHFSFLTSLSCLSFFTSFLFLFSLTPLFFCLQLSHLSLLCTTPSHLSRLSSPFLFNSLSFSVSFFSVFSSGLNWHTEMCVCVICLFVCCVCCGFGCACLCRCFVLCCVGRCGCCFCSLFLLKTTPCVHSKRSRV